MKKLTVFSAVLFALFGFAAHAGNCTFGAYKFTKTSGNMYNEYLYMPGGYTEQGGEVNATKAFRCWDPDRGNTYSTDCDEGVNIYMPRAHNYGSHGNTSAAVIYKCEFGANSGVPGRKNDQWQPYVMREDCSSDKLEKLTDVVNAPNDQVFYLDTDGITVCTKLPPQCDEKILTELQNIIKEYSAKISDTDQVKAAAAKQIVDDAQAIIDYCNNDDNRGRFNNMVIALNLRLRAAGGSTINTTTVTLTVHQNSSSVGIDVSGYALSRANIQYLSGELDKRLDLTVWRNEDGKFNTSRLISDSVAGVVLGTAGGIITSNVIKKNQVNNGFDDISCTVGGQVVAGWGDQFRVGFR